MGVMLRALLLRAESGRVIYGQWDCCLFLAEWGRMLTGIDAAAHVRGRYRTERGAERMLKREGGVIAVVERGALLIGMTPITEPREGAVGVVLVQSKPGVNREVGAIFTGRRWAMLAPVGLLALSCDAIAMWAL